MPHGECADRDLARSMSASTSPTSLGWAALHKLSSKRSSPASHILLAGGQVRIIAVAQGGAEHYLRGRRRVRDLDVIVCFAKDPRLPRLFRRMVARARVGQREQYQALVARGQ
jgi:hypothetical protein